MSYFARYLTRIADTPFAPFLFDAALKATVLLTLAMVATVLLRRSSAAVRHRVWCLTFAALLLLPGLSALLPEWRLAVLPYSSPLAPREESLSLAPQAVGNEPTLELAERLNVDETVGLPLAERDDYFTAAPRADAQAQPTVADDVAQTAARPPMSIAAAWLAGALTALAPLLVGLLRTLYLRRSARSISDSRWSELLDDLCQRLALSRRVTLCETDAALMPMTWGVLRPVVLLPSHAHQWTERLRRIVLLHELAHVKRCDVGFQLLGRIACALYWFHPLAWYALRRLRIERELACDDCVVHSGERASDYAAELLQIAREYRPVYFAAAVAMAQRSNLEHRLRALFDRACSHLPVSPRTARLLLAGVLALLTTISAIRLGPRAAADDAAQTPAAVASPDEGDVVTVSGKVVDPDGKPFAGAKLYAIRWYWEPHIPHPPLAETKSDADGRFTISYRKSQFTVDVGRMDQWKEVSIVATADGFGPGWVTWRDIPRGEQPTLRLVSDDVPISGRVVDLEGKPVAGVSVRVGSIHTGKGGNLDGWLDAVRRGEFPWTAVRHLDDTLPQFEGWPTSVVTGSGGRFRINGLGRERRVHLSFTGPSIAYQDIEAVTRRSDMFPLKFSRSENESEPVYGATFELVAPPTQPIVGIVRDAETRQPLADVSIESDMFAGSNFANERHLRAVSDHQGRYRLVGMPKGKGNQILAVPNDDQPYLMREVTVPESRGLDPLQVDIELRRGVWITGHITDRATGEPLISRVHYLPFLANEYVQKTPEFGTSGRADGYQTRYVSRPDGSYRLVGLPGRAVVGAECVLGNYRQGVGAEKIMGMNEHGGFETYHNPIAPGKGWPNAMKEINPPPGTETVVCDLELDPGETVSVNVLDRDGKPLDGFEVQGSGQSWYDAHDLNNSFDVITLSPDETRTVVVCHKERKLGTVIRVRLADHPSHSFSVTLAPTGRIVGRLLDRHGTPISGAVITAWIKENEDLAEELPTTTTDEQGRFEYADVPSGCHYELDAKATGMKRGGGWFVKDVAIEPGETKDLGDVVYGSAVENKKQPAAAATKNTDMPATAIDGVVLGPAGQPRPRAAEADDKHTAKEKTTSVDDDLVTVSGKVVDPRGKPFPGAKVFALRSYWPPSSEHPALSETMSDADGRFSASFRKSQFDALDQWKNATIAAVAQQFAPAWLRTVTDAAGRFRLVGMPKGKGNRILAVPTDDQPYLMRELNVADPPGLDAVAVDFELHRGIWITGRVTEKATGRPLVARMHYLPFRTNEFASGTPEFGDGGSTHGYQDRYNSDAAGRYRLVGLPGRAIVGAQCFMGRYRHGVGAEKIEGMNDQGNFDTFHNPVHAGRKWPDSMQEINPPAGTDSVVCDLELDPGEKMTLKVVDPAGEPLTGFTIDGRCADGESLSPAETSTAEIINLGPGETRTLVVRHQDRKLAKAFRLHIADRAPHEMALALDPTARIVGRLLDKNGDPIAGATITAFVSPLEDFSKQLPPILTGEDGRFLYDDVPTGCRYILDANAGRMKRPGWFADGVAVEAGKAKDLGDVVYGGAVERRKEPHDG